MIRAKEKLGKRNSAVLLLALVLAGCDWPLWTDNDEAIEANVRSVENCMKRNRTPLIQEETLRDECAIKLAVRIPRSEVAFSLLKLPTYEPNYGFVNDTTGLVITFLRMDYAYYNGSGERVSRPRTYTLRWIEPHGVDKLSWPGKPDDVREFPDCVDGIKDIKPDERDAFVREYNMLLEHLKDGIDKLTHEEKLKGLGRLRSFRKKLGPCSLKPELLEARGVFLTLD